MEDAELHGICTLMCLVILADKRVFMSEIETFTQTLNSLQRATGSSHILTQAEARDWFADNRFQIEAILAAPDRQTLIQNIYNDISEFKYKGALLEALALIAAADRELHAEEINVIRIGALTWGHELPERIVI